MEESTWNREKQAGMEGRAWKGGLETGTTPGGAMDAAWMEGNVRETSRTSQTLGHTQRSVPPLCDTSDRDSTDTNMEPGMFQAGWLSGNPFAASQRPTLPGEG